MSHTWINISGPELEDLKEYLDYHEEDIAIGINDFKDLERVFKQVMNREAQYVNPTSQNITEGNQVHRSDRPKQTVSHKVK